MSMLVADGISIRRSGRLTLRDVSITVRPGRVSVILGPNGAGKSTALKAMSGELAPSEGGVFLDGTPLFRFSPQMLARRRSVLSQSGRVTFPFTVLEVVRLGLETQGLRRDRNEIRRFALGALDEVRLGHLAERPYTEISGGERRRVDLARALCQIGAAEGKEPRYLLLDEPTANLDPDHQLHCLEIARAFATRGGGVLAILHDLNLAALAADEITILKDGGIVAVGPPAEALTREKLRAAFMLPLEPNQPPQDGRPFVLPHSAWTAS